MSKSLLQSVVIGVIVLVLSISKSYGQLPVAGFASTMSEYDESAGALRFTVVISHTSPVDVTVNCTAIGITANNSDFTFTDTVITIPTGSTSKRFILMISDDEFPEGDETIALNLTSPVHAYLGDNVSHLLLIRDNDQLQMPEGIETLPPDSIPGDGGGLGQE